MWSSVEPSGAMEDIPKGRVRFNENILSGHNFRKVNFSHVWIVYSFPDPVQTGRNWHGSVKVFPKTKKR